MSLTVGPERYSAPPVETWMMPSEPASAKPFSAALSVCDDETLMAGKAKPCAFAVSSISAYISGVAMGIGSLPRDVRTSGPTLVPRPGRPEGRPEEDRVPAERRSS